MPSSALVEFSDVGWKEGLVVASDVGGQLVPETFRPHVAGPVCGLHDEVVSEPASCRGVRDTVACRGAFLLRQQVQY